MLIRANYNDDKIEALHAQPMGDLIRYTNDLSKDRSNGFTKERTMRHIGKYNVTTLLDYEKFHPGWTARTQGKDLDDRKKAWKEFIRSEWGKPTATVNPLTV